MSAPTVSVIVCTYRRGSAVKKTLDSILGQSYRDFELIVIDDASGDGTADFVRSIGDPRISVYENEKNLNVAGSRNRGMDLARGRYVAHCDHDDWWDGRKLELQVACMDRNPDYAMLATGVWYVRDSGVSEAAIYPTAAPSFFRWLLFNRSCFLHSSIMVRAHVIRRHGLRYRPDLRFADDWDFFHRIAEVAPIWQIPDRVTYYNLYGENWSVLGETEMNANGRRFMGQHLSRLTARDLAPELVADYFNSVVLGRPCPEIGRLWQVGRLMKDVVNGVTERYAVPAGELAAIRAGAAREWWRVVRVSAIEGGLHVLKAYRGAETPGWTMPPAVSVMSCVARSLLRPVLGRAAGPTKTPY